MLLWALALQVLAIADDLTGALETGARFAGCGVAAVVATEPDCGVAPAAPVLVIDTESRHLPPSEAGEAVRRAACGFPAPLIYKKTDSTLRGNIGAELGALLQIWPERRAVYAPAYPELGRTVRGGRLYLDGVPVERTPFALDPLNPVRTGEIARVLNGVPAEVLDGETTDDVRSAARKIAAARPMPIAAGPAALAGALAELLAGARSAPPEWPRIRRALVINGSLHPASRAQVERLRESGAPEWRIVTADRGPGFLESVELREADALVVIGGDTAFAIHRALGGGLFQPVGEIVPGVPVSRCGGRVWVTKAGGFGPPDLLVEVQERLQ